VTLIDIIPNRHIHNMQQVYINLHRPANDTFMEIMMRDYVRKAIKDALACEHVDRGVILDILRQELELAVVSYFDENVPDDCA
jgi:hypothetical protein